MFFLNAYNCIIIYQNFKFFLKKLKNFKEESLLEKTDDDFYIDSYIDLNKYK